MTGRFGFSSWGWVFLNGRHVRIWRYMDDHLDGAGNVSADGPLYVATEDEDLLLLLSAALEHYHGEAQLDEYARRVAAEAVENAREDWAEECER